MEQLTCDEAEILLNLRLDGLLDETKAARLDAHRATCPACQAISAEMEALNATLAALPDAPVPPAVLAGVLARTLGAAPAIATANDLARWRWPLRVGVALEAAAAALLLLLYGPLVSAFARELISLTAWDAAGRWLADGLSDWLIWFNVQAVSVQTQWQSLADQASSLMLVPSAPEPIVQAVLLLAAVLAVWVAGNRVLATVAVGPNE